MTAKNLERQLNRTIHAIDRLDLILIQFNATINEAIEQTGRDRNE